MDDKKYNTLLKSLTEERDYILQKLGLPNNLNPKRKIAKRKQLISINSRIKGLKLYRNKY